MDRISKRYQPDTPKEYVENMTTAKEEYKKLCENRGHAFVSIVVSNHWASEGIWVEASDSYPNLSGEDQIVELFDRDGTF